MLLNAASIFNFRSSRFVGCCAGLCYTLFLTKPHTKMSGGVRSGELGGHAILSLKVTFENSRTFVAQWGYVPQDALHLLLHCLRHLGYRCLKMANRWRNHLAVSCKKN